MKKYITLEEFKQFIVNTRNSNYTKFNFNKEFKINYMKPRKEFVKHDVIFRNCLLISFKSFYKENILRIKELLKTTNEEYLILDLRNNAGGDLESCIDLAKMFIGDKEIATLKYLDNIKVFKGSKPEVSFKKIFVFLNDVSASCSEILSLTLKENLPNVFLIGNNTFGKNVGTTNYINRKYKFIFSIVSYEWFVNNKNTTDLNELLKSEFKDKLKTNNDYLSYVLKKLDI